MSAEPTDTPTLLRELEPVVEANLNRHLATAKEWFPHEYVPWSDGTNFDGVLGGEAWEPSQSKLSDVARTSLIVNLLTEDNLPSYHHEIAAMFGRDGAWGTWVHRWTAEEGRHGVAIRDYLLTTRAVDPVALERARMTHMEVGFTNDYDERDRVDRRTCRSRSWPPASRTATPARISGDPICDQLLAKVAADENLHMLFYRNLLDGRVRPGAQRRDAGGVRGGQGLPDARAHDRELRPQVGADRHGRHLRPAHPPRRGGHADPAAAAGVRTRRACPARASRPARSWWSSWPGWTRPRPGSPNAARRPGPGPRPAPRPSCWVGPAVGSLVRPSARWR